MTKAELEKAFDTAIEDFIATTKVEFGDPYSKESATLADIDALSAQTATALKAFKYALLEYLD